MHQRKSGDPFNSFCTLFIWLRDYSNKIFTIQLVKPFSICTKILLFIILIHVKIDLFGTLQSPFPVVLYMNIKSHFLLQMCFKKE